MDLKVVLVTGGAGFIGSNFVSYLLNTEPDVLVINLDVLTYAGRLENLKALPDPERHIFIKGDINDSELVRELLKRYKVDTIVHFAAETHVDRSISGPENFIKTNVMGTLQVLGAATNFWLKDMSLEDREVRFHHISTDEVYGSLGPNERAWTESSPYAPNSPYAASKAASDHLVRAFGHTYGLPYAITNCSNNYGPYQFPEKLIPLMILNALEGKPLPIYGDGKQIRDWLYVADHCEAILKVIKMGKAGETYNVGGGVQPTNLEIVDNLCVILDTMIPDPPHAPHRQLITFVPDRPGHDRRYAIDCNKICRELDWGPKCDIKEGLRKTVTWYLENLDWLSAIRGEGSFIKWVEKNYIKRGG